jgi:hypothetical protein
MTEHGGKSGRRCRRLGMLDGRGTGTGMDRRTYRESKQWITLTCGEFFEVSL